MSTTGILNKNEDGKFLISLGEFNQLLLSSGTVIEVFDESYHIWTKTRLEFNGISNEYYGTCYNLKIGQKVRLPRKKASR